MKIKRVLMLMVVMMVIVPTIFVLSGCRGDHEIVGKWERPGHSNGVVEIWEFRGNGTGTVTVNDINVPTDYWGWYPTEYEMHFNWRWVNRRIAGWLIDSELVLTGEGFTGTDIERQDVYIAEGMLAWNNIAMTRVA